MSLWHQIKIGPCLLFCGQQCINACAHLCMCMCVFSALICYICICLFIAVLVVWFVSWCCPSGWLRQHCCLFCLSHCRIFAAFITGLLNNIGTHVDPIILIQKIREGLEIPGLRNSLVQILHDYYLQVKYCHISLWHIIFVSLSVCIFSIMLYSIWTWNEVHVKDFGTLCL